MKTSGAGVWPNDMHHNSIDGADEERQLSVERANTRRGRIGGGGCHIMDHGYMVVDGKETI